MEKIKETKRLSSSKRTRNLSRHNNKIKPNQNKSKLNPNNNKKNKQNINNNAYDKNNKKINNNNNSIFNYRSKKKKEGNKRKSNIGVGRLSPTEEQLNKKSVENDNEHGIKRSDNNNYYAGVTKPSSLFVTSSAFNNTSFEKIDEPHYKKPTWKDNKKPNSAKGTFPSIYLSKFGKLNIR